MRSGARATKRVDEVGASSVRYAEETRRRLGCASANPAAWFGEALGHYAAHRFCSSLREKSAPLARILFRLGSRSSRPLRLFGLGSIATPLRLFSEQRIFAETPHRVARTLLSSVGPFLFLSAAWFPDPSGLPLSRLFGFDFSASALLPLWTRRHIPTSGLARSAVGRPHRMLSLRPAAAPRRFANLSSKRKPLLAPSKSISKPTEQTPCPIEEMLERRVPRLATPWRLSFFWMPQDRAYFPLHLSPPKARKRESDASA